MPLTIGFHNIWAGQCIDELISQHFELGQRADAVFCSEVLHHPSAEDRILISKHVDTAQEWEGELQSLTLMKRALGERFSTLFHHNTLSDWECRRTSKRYPGTRFGNALYYRDDLHVLATGRWQVFSGSDRATPRSMQTALLEYDDQRYLLGHLHGVWLKGNTKGDAPERDEQSRGVKETLGRMAKEYETDKIIFGGDLNLDIDTNALRILEHEGMPLRNLVREYDVADTRTSLYREYGVPGKSMYADHVLVSDAVAVESFAVHNNVLSSDHALLEVTLS